MIEIVNIVASGEVEGEFDLVELSTDIGHAMSEYEPEMYHGLYIRFDDDGPLVTMYDSGKYIVVGSKSFDQVQEIRNKFLELLTNLDKLQDPEDICFKIQNIVGTVDFNCKFDLDKVVVDLGFENAEYNPEQFPGVIYRDEKNDCVVSIYQTGRITVVGAKSRKSIEHSITKVQKKLKI